jgi:hypothetical protein
MWLVFEETNRCPLKALDRVSVCGLHGGGSSINMGNGPTDIHLKSNLFLYLSPISMPEPEVTSHQRWRPHRVEAGTSMAASTGSGCVRGRRGSDSERAAARVFTSRPPVCGPAGLAGYIVY